MKRYWLIPALIVSIVGLLILISLADRQSDQVLSRWSNISTVIQAYLILVSFAFIWFEFHQSLRLTKAANSQALAEQAGNFNALLIQDPKVAKLWYSHGKNLDRPEFADIAASERYRELLIQWFILHENIFYQNEKCLLDPMIYNGWLADLKATLRDHEVAVVANDFEEIFPGEFGQHLNKLRGKVRVS